MGSQSTSDRDIPARKADVDAILAALVALGTAGLALEAGGNLEAVKDALIAGGYSGSRINTIANALTSGGYSALRLEAIKAALEAAGYTGSRLEALAVAFAAGGSMYLLTDAIKTSVETGGNLELAVQAVVTALTDASQKTQVVDSAGNVAGMTANSLHVKEDSGTGILAALGATAANFIKTAVDAVATVLGPAGSVGILLTAIEARIAPAGTVIVALNQVTTELQAIRTATQVPFTWTGVGTAQVDLTAGLTAGAKYEIFCVCWDSVTGDGATSVQVALGRVTGFTPGADRDELYRSSDLAYAANVIGAVEVYSNELPFLADGAGHLWLHVTTTAGTSAGSGYIWVRRTL